MESKSKDKSSNIVVEYDDMGRRIWKVVDPTVSQKIAPPPGALPPGITMIKDKNEDPEENKEKRKYKRDTLKGRDYKVDFIRKMDGKEYKIAKDTSVETVTPFHCKT